MKENSVSVEKSSSFQATGSPQSKEVRDMKVTPWRAGYNAREEGVEKKETQQGNSAYILFYFAHFSFWCFLWVLSWQNVCWNCQYVCEAFICIGRRPHCAHKHEYMVFWKLILSIVRETHYDYYRPLSYNSTYKIKHNPLSTWAGQVLALLAFTLGHCLWHNYSFLNLQIRSCIKTQEWKLLSDF